MNEKIVIFKNEKTGDLIHSYNAIKKIISNNANKEIIIYLSYYNFEMRFLFDSNNVRVKCITEKISFIDKLKILIYLFKKNIIKVYIFKPSFFLFILPIFFGKIKFYGICVKNNSYLRPPKFLRQFLTNFVVNDRGTTKIRPSIHDLHLKLINNEKNSIKFSSINNKYIKDNKKYLLIHFNKFKFNMLNWGLNELYIITEKLGEHFDYIALTNDINDEETNTLLSKKYSDFNTAKVKYYPNIKGKSLFELIGNANLVLSFHGMITSIGALQNTKVLDLFNCQIKNKKDFYKYKNAFHEFKPKLDSYEFIIPRENCLTTLKKINRIIANGRKINNKII